MASGPHPSDRLKQIAAKARSEKLRAAVQQLKATGPPGELSATPSPGSCSDAQQLGSGTSTIAISLASYPVPAGSGCGNACILDDLDQLLDDINLGLLPGTLGPGHEAQHNLNSGRAMSSTVHSRAKRVLAEARAEKAASMQVCGEAGSPRCL